MKAEEVRRILSEEAFMWSPGAKERVEVIVKLAEDIEEVKRLAKDSASWPAWKDIRQQVGLHSDGIAQLRETLERLEARVKAVEERPVGKPHYGCHDVSDLYED